MSEDLMRYDLMAQEALRGVVRTALERVAQSGLPGSHHFFIAFDTLASGVRMSERLRAQYEKEMTIVLQHQFWNLEVGKDRFSVELNFNNAPEQLVVPFAAIKGFFDPSVQFGLQFEAATEAAGEDANENTGEAGGITAMPRQANERLGQTGAANEDDEERADMVAEVVELDAFRKK